MGTFTNIFGNNEIVNQSPDCSGDYYFVSDKQADFNYFLSKISEILVGLSDNPSEEFQIIYGGAVSDGGGGTIDISECLAMGTDADDNKRFIALPAQTGLALPTDFDDGRQVWVTLKYDSTLSTATRVHKASSSYHYQLDDTYLGDENGLEEGDSDSFFTDSDPTGTALILGSFTMTGTTYADLSERSETFRPLRLTGIINRQSDFNAVIERTGANAYQIKDEFTSLTIKNNGTGYLCYDTGSFLSDGDTYGVLSTNNCVNFEMEQGAYLSIGDTAFYLNVNTDNTFIKNVWLKGIGSSGVNCRYSIRQYTDIINVTFDNCKVSNRLLATGLHSVFYGVADNNSKIINCSAIDISSNHYIEVFNYFYSMSNCSIKNVDNSSGTQALYGFTNCKNLKNCFIDEFISTGGATAAYGFNGCTRLDNCYIADSESTKQFYGFSGCLQLSNCSVEGLETISANVFGFNNCSQLSNCLVEGIVSNSGISYGFNVCVMITSCYSNSIFSSSNNAYGFVACHYMSSCNAGDITSSSATANGFNSCTYMAACYTAEPANASNNFVDTIDAQITDKVSCPSIFT